MKYVKTIRDGQEIKFPYFRGIGDQKPRANWLTEERHSVVVIIRNPKTDEYLCVDSKTQNCKSFVMGGIENYETPEQSAIREVSEETGFDDIAIDRVADFTAINHFFAAYKNVNRYAYIKFVYGHLRTNHRREISEKEKSKHDILWIARDDLANFLNVEICRFAAGRLD